MTLKLIFLLPPQAKQYVLLQRILYTSVVYFYQEFLTEAKRSVFLRRVFCKLSKSAHLMALLIYFNFIIFKII